MTCEVDNVCCSICLDSYDPSETKEKLTVCGHEFHIHCIQKWFQVHNTCPLCRQPQQSQTHSLQEEEYADTTVTTLTMHDVHVIFNSLLCNYKNSQNDRDRIYFLNKIYDIVHQHNLHYDNRYLHQLNVANIGYYFI